MIVSMVVAGIALAMVAAVSARQQRVFADLADRSALSGQLREASAILPIDVRAAAAGSGDFRDARDTALEMRGTIASAVVCDTAPGRIILAPAVNAPTTYTSILATIEAGDSVWMLSGSDTGDTWQPYRVTGAASS